MTLFFDILAGLFLGMCYDLFKAFRRKTKASAVGVLLDVLFWVIALLVSIRLFLLSGDRKFRFYELFGLISGFWCYFLTVSKYFVKISGNIADIVLIFLKFLFTILRFFAIISKNGVLFLLKPFGKVIHFGTKRITSGFQKWKRNVKLMKRI